MTPTFASLLQAFRIRAKLSKKRLAELAQVDRNRLADWEAGKRIPRDYAVVKDLAQRLGLSAEEERRLEDSYSAGRPLRDRADVISEASQIIVEIDSPSNTRIGISTPDTHEVIDTNHAPTIKPDPVADALALLQTMPTDIGSTIPSPTVLPYPRRVSLRPNPLFVGRDRDLQRVALQFKHDSNVVILTGIGGIGKTQLAVEFAHRYGQYFAGGVFWLSFADPVTLKQEIAACGRPGSLGLFQESEGMTLDEKVEVVQRTWELSVPRLLIFDNCGDEQVLADVLPRTGGCRVLVTSRRQVWDRALNVIIQPIDGLDREDSIALVRKHRPDLDGNEAAGIASELGDLPLALHLAGNFLAQYKYVVTPTAFLEQLQRPDLLRHPALQGHGINFSPTGRELHVAKVFMLSFERLDSHHPTDALAIELLARAACFAPNELIPRDLLVATLMRDGNDTHLQSEDALIRLTALGLLEHVVNGALRIHRLLAAFTHDVAVDAQSHKATRKAILEAASKINQHGLPLLMEPLLGHISYVITEAERRHNSDETILPLVEQLAEHFWRIGEVETVVLFHENLLDGFEKFFGPEHPETANKRFNLAVLLSDLGEYIKAQKLLEQTLVVDKKLLGSNHPKVADTLNALAMVLRHQGRYIDARDLLEQALKIQKLVLDFQHPDIALTLNNLGLILIELGEYEAAKLHLNLALEIYEGAKGTDHPDTAQVFDNLALAYAGLGELARAQLLHMQALSIYEQTLGFEHPLTVQSLNNLAVAAFGRKDYTKAQELFEQVVAIRERNLGPRHPDTVTSLNNIAATFYGQGKYAEAQALFEQVVAIREQILGTSHPATAESLHNLANSLHKQEKDVEAKMLLERALSIYQQTLGNNHPVSQLIHNSLQNYL
jgi:tetratricopeptide (TPR) repeat protein/transcriptional regulator with XRE-family HTH domain